MNEFKIGGNDCGQRVDKFIGKALPDMPKSLMYKLIRKKDIKLNGKRCEISTVLQEGDILRIYAPESFTPKKPAEDFLAAPSKLDIVYEDDELLIVNKPINLAVHADNDHSPDTLISRIRHYLYDSGAYDPHSEASFAPSLCSRLDKNTCGLVTAAKTASALREVNAAIRNGNVTKIYHCAAVGAPPQDNGIAEAFHFKEQVGNIVRISDKPLNGYKPIKTGYRLLSRTDELSLFEITLFTGRTHQIRAHLAHLGCPVLGDGKYGDISANKRFKLFTQALCAFSLRFRFPEDSPLSYMNEKKIIAPKPDFEELFT